MSPFPKLRVGHPGEKAQATRLRAATVWFRRQRAHGTVPLHEATSAVGKDIRKSESLTVPVKAGNLPKGTRWREREAGSWNRRKER
jgi:hypothetical protein